jgi:uncharacterized membrane protein YvbJ
VIKVVYCKKCGKESASDAYFCSYCGSSLKEVKTEELRVSSDDLVKKVKEIIHEGNARRIIIKDDKGKTLLEIPVTVGVIGAIFAPWLAALGVIAALVTNCTIVVERK